MHFYFPILLNKEKEVFDGGPARGKCEESRLQCRFNAAGSESFEMDLKIFMTFENMVIITNFCNPLKYCVALKPSRGKCPPFVLDGY